ncbi:hypothetical protein, partial [Paraburkholderia sp. SIMBA_027]|uniref:hypothetical protein n=1 Tax=Paraburkholderia sp. SIMBA_027 TaxID=3085770 RepID=UPI003978E5B4
MAKMFFHPPVGLVSLLGVLLGIAAKTIRFHLGLQRSGFGLGGFSFGLVGAYGFLVRLLTQLSGSTAV